MNLFVSNLIIEQDSNCYESTKIMYTLDVITI